MKRTLQYYFDARSASTTSYFDFVEKKIDTRCSTVPATELANTGKDAFVVQMMDEETSRALKQQYFNGQAFPARR